ncbi:hypothetical protein E2C01_063816 [Portunus trituberculatus]|uniref:Uncharacterized protein n=1 Tax=Portunus trituberculatus TaxID=210409 RepID=A0A5B7HI37_PORTR|nr:hypothetical protein [Portunus trituberculatus]
MRLSVWSVDSSRAATWLPIPKVIHDVKLMYTLLMTQGREERLGKRFQNFSSRIICHKL